MMRIGSIAGKTDVLPSSNCAQPSCFLQIYPALRNHLRFRRCDIFYFLNAEMLCAEY